MILSKALTPGLHKCLMFKPSRSTRQVQELNLRDKKKNLSNIKILFAYASAQHPEMWGPSACFGFFCFTSLLCAAYRHWSLRGVQWSLCTLPYRHFRFQRKVQFLWSQKKILSTVSPKIKPLLLLGDHLSDHSAALKQFDIHRADFLLHNSANTCHR